MTTDTSREAYRTLDASSMYALILSHLNDGHETCIADCATELGIQKSTMSARFNELKNMGKLEYAGKKPSRTTGITSMHWKVVLQNSLF